MSSEERGEVNVDERDPAGGVAERGADSLHVASEALCWAVAERVVVRLDGLVDVMMGAICEEVDGYAGLPGDVLEAVRDRVTYTARLFLGTLVEGRRPSAAELRPLEAVGEERAFDGVSLDDLEAAVSAANAAGFDYLHDELAALVGEWPERSVDRWAAFRDLSLHAQEFRTAHWAALCRGYRRSHAGDVAATRGEFVASLVSGAFDSDEEIQRVARNHGGELSPPAALLVFVGVGDRSRDLPGRIATLRPVLSSGLVSPTLADPRPHGVALVSLGRQTWAEIVGGVEERLKDAGLVALAEPATRLVDLADVYQGVRERLTVMHRFPARARVLRPLDLTLVWAASQAGERSRFLDVDAVLGPVLARRRQWAERDMETLTALRIHGGDFAAVARRLGVKFKEVRRKLREIERRSGLNLDNPVDVTKLGWALSLYWSDPESLPPPGDAAWGRSARAAEIVESARVG